MAWTRFTLSATPPRSDIIESVNRFVNNGIDPEGSPKIDDPWSISPQVGWCHD
jgi:hypothetical protein